MNVLDSHLEALAFNYLSFGFLTLLNSLWTWVALVTAAVSFWRIRAAGCPKTQLHLPSDDPISTAPDLVPAGLMLDDVVGEREPPPPAVVGDGGADVDGVTKGKFTVYYKVDDMQCSESSGEEPVTATEEWGERGGRSDWWERWEKLLRMRTGENESGWYTWQDLTALNGNVVRLWDDGFDTLTFSKESWYSTSCIRVW